ncbi:Conserved_hypothetical protein [Hexamita inflata]|uniref:Myb-like DNA-binding domain-containing protein n=1 Tax=Hexamita inflata TaxID=28002 RepID=A0AA86RBM6_9EUKA|nr:Conserved hypothetical protein [Hexamita inflata]
MKSCKWSNEEQKLFEYYIKLYQTDFHLIAELLPNRTYSQVRSHFYNELKRKQNFQLHNEPSLLAQLYEELSRYDTNFQRFKDLFGSKQDYHLKQ